MDLFDKRYEKIALIGRGAFSEVWKVTDTQTGVTMALKIFTMDADMDANGIEMLTREFALMIDADHQNLLHPLYFGFTDDHVRQPYLTLPYCKGGNISKLMGKLSEREAWKLIRDTASALAYLHAMNPPIIHQDIKPANILIGNDGYYKLADFGVSVQARSTMGSQSDKDDSYFSAGTISYMAPEKFSKDNRPIMANDVYSLGATVFEMLAGYLPFGPDGGLIQKKGAEIPILPGNFSSRLKQTLEDCLNEAPWERPTASKLEEIAIDALSKAPTVIETVEPRPALQDTADSPYSSQPIQKKSKLPLILAGITLIALICAVFFFFLPNQPEPKGEPQTYEQPIKTEEPEVMKEPEVIKEPEVMKEPEVIKEPVTIKKPERIIEQAPKTDDVKPQRASGALNLGYATWEGNSVNGKPNGYGTMIFSNSHRIDSRDEQGRIAQSGDKVKGNYVNGHLEYGTWIKSDGSQEEIFIGQ